MILPKVALSIRQPWAWAIVSGHKSVENRDWNTNFRGDFLIHTGLKIDPEGIMFCRYEGGLEVPEKLQTGGFVGIATLIHVIHERDKSHLTERDKPWFFGEYGFILENARPIPFIPYKGQLSFFKVDL